MPADAPGPIVLTTDFGLSDPYVGVMRGVILNINPQATIVDLTHQVLPQNIRQAAFVLGTSYRFFPPESIHAAVVDPGVGTQRKAVCLTTPAGIFLAPDNGLLSCILADFSPNPSPTAGPAAIPPSCAAFELSNPRCQLQPLSSTFHGRDIFSPAAAHLSLGVPPQELGGPLTTIFFHPPPFPSRQGRRLTGEIIYADHFGNLITNIAATLLPIDSMIEIEVKAVKIRGLSVTFHQDREPPGQTPIALIGSNGYLEIAVPDGNAAHLLAAAPGDPVSVNLSP